MFDLITGREKHLPSHATVPILMSTMAQASIIGILVGLPLLYATDHLPEIPTMMAFVAAVPAPPPPPPPPPPAAPKPAETRAKPVPSDDKFLAPIEEPAKIAELPDDEGFDRGVPGGVEGGIPGGVVGGVVGGLPDAPPPPPPPPVERAPVRIGGVISPPQLLHRVEPDYPSFAAKAHLEGVVILEAMVDQEGNVTDVKVLRSPHALLDREAQIAVRQWRYSPLVLNGIRERFILTVTLSFRLQPAS
jgi:protein TonB